MTTTLFKFYPPKKKKNPYLVPNSDLLPSSLLSPLSKNAKKRKFCGAKNTHPAFGPANANAMSSGLPVIPGPSVGGYGVSNYGGLAYGESIDKPDKPALLEAEKTEKTEKPSINRIKYSTAESYKNIFEGVDKY